MNLEVVVEEVDCVPEFERGSNPPEETRTFIRIDTEARTCRVYQEESRYELTQDEFDNIVVVHPLSCRPDGDDLEAWLEGAAGQELLSGICGWRTKAGLAKLLDRLDAAVALLEPDETNLWEAAEWFSQEAPEVTPQMTDSEVRRIAREEYEDALNQNAMVDGIYEFLLALRDELREQEQNRVLEAAAEDEDAD